MRQIIGFSLLLSLFFGCGKDEKNAETSRTVSLDDLTVTIRDHPRSYFLSDKRGGFLIATAGQGTEQRQEWSVNGQTVLRDLGSIMIDGKAVDRAAIDSVRVTPLEVVRFFHSGIVETTAPLDQVLGEEEAHGVAVQVQASIPGDIMFTVQPGAGFVSAPKCEPQSILFEKGTGASLAYSAGAQGESSPDGITVKQASKAVFVVVYTSRDSAHHLAQRTQGEVELLRHSRRDRMEKLLQRAYLRTSDLELTRALRWMQLSLDGLTIANTETTAVAALPWDGSLSVRDNAVALAGLDVATGDYAATAGMLRSLARHEDTSVDGAAWFARELYEHVTGSGDTAIVRDLYPMIRAKLVHAAERHADGSNLFFAENSPTRGIRSADQQALWYFHQAICSIFGAFLSDSANAAHWALQADRTSSAFNQVFVDTSRNMIFDQIASNGRGSTEAGPGALLCLDMIESEAVRQNTVKTIMKTLLRPDGIVTPAPRESKAAGAIHNWMAGQMVYALTRYDCQHISYPVTRRLASRILMTDMVGVLPEMYGANEAAGALGAPASLTAMAEFIRSFYQDYLGVHMNMTTKSLALEPKLPDEIRVADFTIFAGNHPVAARYERMADKDRVILNGDGLTDSLRVTFVWVMKNGNAWRGITALHPGKMTTLLFGDRDATAFYDGKEARLESVRHLVGFSQRAQMEKGL